MASFSSSSSSTSSSTIPIKSFHVFTSFHGPDVRKGFLSHLRNHFETNNIKMFNDQKIERGHSIGRELLQAIRESIVSIVVFSKNYASSSWCLDELVEIFKCRNDFGQVVLPIFYDVDPSDVRKQMGDFGKAFKKTCEGKTKEVKKGWTEALKYVATIAGEHSKIWVDEAKMIQKIITDVAKILKDTPSIDFEGMVGLEAHLNKLECLLCLECADEVKMIGIWGPAGVGKTTIAEALYNQISTSFPRKFFLGNLKRNCKSSMGSYDSMLSLETKLFYEKVDDLGNIKELLQDQKVLIVLDDVEQLEALAKEISWFGLGSRIIVTSEDMEILRDHGIQDIYNVSLPSKKEALEILCLSAFNHSSVSDGFEKLAEEVAKFCGNLPLGLCVVGSSLRGETKDEWEILSSKIEHIFNGKIEDALQMGYDRLSKKCQSLFLHIACCFNNEVVGNVTSVLADSNLDVENGLKILADKSLLYISMNGKITMHHLLQQLGRQIVLEQSERPEERQFLVDAKEIRKILTNTKGSKSLSLMGITFYSDKDRVLSKRAFEGMPNLQFLRIYCKEELDWLQWPKGKLHIPSSMTYLPPLRSLYWHLYPRKSLPPRFQTERLIELHLPNSDLEKLWDEIKPLPNLKIIDLSCSYDLKEIPNLSKATNLEKINLTKCISVVELPSSISNLPKLKKLYVSSCETLKSIPALNSPSLKSVYADHCISLESVCCSFQNTSMTLSLGGCWFLDEESKREIIEQLIDGCICLPGREIPAEFIHKSTGNSVTIYLAPGTFFVSSSLRACIRIWPLWDIGHNTISCSVRRKGGGTVQICSSSWYMGLSGVEHLIIFHFDLSSHEISCAEFMSEITFEFSLPGHDDKIIESGVRIMPVGTEGSSSSELENNKSSELDDNKSSELENNKSSELDNNNKSSELENNKRSELDDNKSSELDNNKSSELDNNKSSEGTVSRSWLKKILFISFIIIFYFSWTKA